MAARFLIGIDLGTTNSAVAYVDARAADHRVRGFEVPQLVAPGEVAPRRQLPSFVYLASEIDLAPHETALPWQPAREADAGKLRIVVGELARSQGARMASRMISSAKSWLCHPGVDRHAAILPWGESEGPKLSPVGAQAHVLGHIRQAWDAAHPDAPFAEQDVLVTVPASFDEAARELTQQAALAAGYPPIVLLEEPQAAFYAWMDAGGRKQLAPGDRVLVFDVGGGTTDFTLIEVDESGDGFTRTAVGDHLLLGGDNLDLTLAKIVEQRVASKAGKKLDALQWHGLVHACRLAKEQLLAEGGPEVAPIVVHGRGSKLIAGTLRDDVTREELSRVLFDGFFPLVAKDAPLQRGRGGLQEFGLPYAADPAVTRHLAQFLARHAGGPGDRIAHVLFNGGAMTPKALRDRVLEQIAEWQGARPNELPATAPELAVAQGAAYYGLVRRGLATRIKGGTPRAFYIGVDSDGGEQLAVCLAPAGLEDGARVTLDRDFTLVTNRPVSFRLYSSSSRHDAPGALVPVGDGRAETLDDGSDLLELPPIVTALRARASLAGRGDRASAGGQPARTRSEVNVRLAVHVTELGALEIACVAGGAAGPAESWKLAFDMRSGGTPPEAAAEAHPKADEAKQRVAAAFTTGATQTLARDLEALLEVRRDEWSMMTTRALFDTLAEVAAERKRSADAEQRWLNLAGFLLRPGTGAPLDAWRARVMWGVFNENLAYPKSEPNRLAWWIAWRRIAGGLATGQQEQIFDRIAQLLLPSAKQAKKLADAKPSKQEVAEMWRAVASMERLPLGGKLKLGDELLQRLATRKGRDDAAHLWSLARIGARVPLYGPLNAVVPPSQVKRWLEPLLAGGSDAWPEPDKVAFPLAQLGRRTGDRARDLDDATRDRLAAIVRALPGGERAVVLVEQVVALEAREERVALGDTLPAGLRLAAEES